MASEIIVEDIAKVKKLLSDVLGSDSYTEISRMGGLTNHTYKIVREDGGEYVVRIPGEGTEEMIVRADEMVSTKLACDIGIDAPLLYFGSDGSKVTGYIPRAITMSSDTLKLPENIEKIASIFRTLHGSGADTGVPFEVFDMAESYERIIADKCVSMFDDYSEVTAEVMSIKQEIDSCIDVKKVPCHNDPLCENWVVGDGRMYLIDWEYAGMNDGMWDLADVSIEAGYDAECDRLLLLAYTQREPDKLTEKHFLASKLYVDYLWTLWAKARVPYDGQPMEDWALDRYTRLKNNLRIYKSI